MSINWYADWENEKEEREDAWARERAEELKAKLEQAEPTLKDEQNIYYPKTIEKDKNGKILPVQLSFLPPLTDEEIKAYKERKRSQRVHEEKQDTQCEDEKGI